MNQRLYLSAKVTQFEFNQLLNRAKEAETELASLKELCAKQQEQLARGYEPVMLERAERIVNLQEHLIEAVALLKRTQFMGTTPSHPYQTKSLELIACAFCKKPSDRPHTDDCPLKSLLQRITQ